MYHGVFIPVQMVRKSISTTLLYAEPGDWPGPGGRSGSLTHRRQPGLTGGQVTCNGGGGGGEGGLKFVTRAVPCHLRLYSSSRVSVTPVTILHQSESMTTLMSRPGVVTPGNTVRTGSMTVADYIYYY